jgi:hypothetical protein
LLSLRPLLPRLASSEKAVRQKLLETIECQCDTDVAQIEKREKRPTHEKGRTRTDPVNIGPKATSSVGLFEILVSQTTRGSAIKCSIQSRFDMVAGKTCRRRKNMQTIGLFLYIVNVTHDENRD